MVLGSKYEDTAFRSAEDGIARNRAVERDELPAAANGERDQIDIGDLARSVDPRISMRRLRAIVDQLIGCIR